MLKSRGSVPVSAFVLVVVVGVTLAVIWEISVERRYARAFQQTEIGESLNSVLLRFGEPSDVAGHIVPGETGRQPPCDKECWLRLWYMSPVFGGVSPYSVDFGPDQKVIGKFHWSSP
jgi:hypothetical protein